MTDTAWYQAWFNSPFYHQLYFERNEEEARLFIDRLVQHLQPQPGSLVVDIACGRGRHSRMLAGYGLEVTGVDLAPDNIAHAQQAGPDNIQFFIHDIRLPFWVNYFDYAFNLFTGFGYFRTRREHDDAMRTIAGSLKPGGIVVFDYLNPHFAEDHLVPDEVKEIGATRYDIRRWHDETHFYKKIKIADPTLPDPYTVTEQLAKFSLGDFTDMLSFQSLQVQQVFGDYQLGAYDIRKTPRLIVIAKKRTHHPEDKEKRLYSDGRTTDALT
ncbi:MAG: class I SAM-dependent methyltransferase [Chitinophagaceae bacterium]